MKSDGMINFVFPLIHSLIESINIMARIRIIYIPGLGDSDVSAQQKAVNFWRHWQVEPELFQMKWANDEPWEAKFASLLARIDEIATSGQPIGLVAASAGATAAISAYAARKKVVCGVVLIAGKANRPHAVGEGFKSKNPAFGPAAHASAEAIKSLTASDRARILSRYALADELVYKPDSRIPGAKNRLVPTVGHVITIATQLTLGAPSFLRFLKKMSMK